MKITKSQLKQIIQEELESVIQEGWEKVLPDEKEAAQVSQALKVFEKLGFKEVSLRGGHGVQNFRYQKRRPDGVSLTVDVEFGGMKPPQQQQQQQPTE